MKKKSIWKHMKPFISPHKKTFLIALVLIVIFSTSIALSPYIEGLITTSLKNSVDQDIPVDFSYIIKILVVLLGIYITNFTTEILYKFMLTDAIQKTMLTLRSSIQRKIHKLPVKYFDGHTTGDLMSRMSGDVETVGNAMQQSLSAFATAILGLLFAVAMMLFINLNLGIMVTLVIPISMIYARFIISKSQKKFAQLQSSMGRLTGIIQEKYTGYKEIILFDKQEDSIEEFALANADMSRSSFESQFVSGLLTPGLTLFIYIEIALVIFIGGKNILAGVMVVGQLQAFIRYVWQVSNPLTQMSDLSSILQSAAASAGRIFEVLDEDEEVRDIDSPIHIEDTKGSVQLKDVSFGYDPDRILLHDLNINIEAGQMVAIVGPTGVGKTTLINLLMRFYDVSGGAICVDGVDIRDMKRDDLRANFGMVLQDTWLFKGTIKENIAYGVDGASDEDIIAAARIANADHFIRTLPDGYDMEINEEGNNVSQGEKQLLTIARAVLSDPKIMILDEATSSVDTRLEQMLQDAMAKIMEGRTSFVIAHRLSTIKNADIILVMRDGNIVEHGNHEELLKQKGYYESLYNAQFRDQAKDVD